MNATQIHATFKTALQFLSSGRVKNAFEKTVLLVDELQMGEYTDKLNDLQQNYHLLLRYFKDGISDPERKLVYNKLIARTFALNNELREELLLRNSSNFEYTQKRYFPFSKKYNSGHELLISLRYYHSQWALISPLEDTHEAELNRIRSNYETAMDELFSIFWLNTQYGNQEKELFTAIATENYPGQLEKTLLVSALMLNLWRMFDETKLSMLFDMCLLSDQQVRQRALTGLCFVLARHNRFLSFFPSVRNRLMLLTDDNHIVENFRNIFIQIISTAETDKISKKMQEEILPEMMKISPKLRDKTDDGMFPNNEEWNEENPEWEELINDSKLTDKLLELSELQMEGADVYMSTFSALKHYPFFNTFSNWFIPFDAEHSSIKALFGSSEKSLITAFVSNDSMCNSDKYSFCLSTLQMPESQRMMMQHSFRSESEELHEIAQDTAILTPDINAKNISKQFIQDIFRFFKLHPKRSEFSDMFGFSLLLHRTFLFDLLSFNENFKESIAEYYFSKNHYDKAVELFEQMKADNNTNAAFFQKLGYSYQQLPDFDAAFEAYQKADFIQPDDVWTIRKMAVCARLSGNFSKALEYYQHVDYLKPDQKTVQMQIGHCYIELSKYKEALAIFFKLDALGEDDVRVWRSIAWCSFITSNISQAEYYIQKTLADKPLASDYLNAGHIAWCQGKTNEAIGFYALSKRLQPENQDIFLKAFNDDKPYLLANGVNADDIPLMLDSLD